ncbi:MAG: hypothetical protein A3G75_03050 [Verrucomicrobia bacterium RIFCSPLOWO2_12_FULL_64_8]|nr:MAG: hypothetical protein A3G75_03050 [Verrucomicrobia bacterium RIFCSPLOWO2_12_FULL_64_8]
MKFSSSAGAALAVVLLSSLPPLAAAPARVKAVEVELVPAVASIQPGRPFDLALRMKHDPHWHSYWIFAGTGYATKLTWKLPAGWQAGAIQWPVPHMVKTTLGAITGNGYEGEVFLFATLTPPAGLAPGTEVALKAQAEWLMCEEVCVPGDVEMTLNLPVAAEPPASHPVWGPILAAARRDLPQDPAGWSLSATRTEKNAVLAFQPPAGRTYSPDDFRFFSDDGFISFDEPQPVRMEKDGVFAATLTIDPANPKKDITRLTGVLALKGGDVRGIRVDLPLAAAAQGGPSTFDSRPSTTPATGGLAGTLVFAFLGGLILNLMPCVFPVLGIKILGFVNQAGAERRKVVLHGLTFTAGVLVSFWLLAGLYLVLRAGGRQVGWGFQLQEPGVVFALAVVMLGFALNLSGLFEVGLSATGVGAGLQSKSGYAGSFFTGVLATVVATPCSAPFLVTALSAALTLPPAASIAMFTCIGVGLSAPYLVLSSFPAFVRFLPRPGAWMESFKQFMAFPLYLTVGWLVWVLAGQTRDNDYALLYVLAGLTLVALAAWFYGRYAQAHGKPARQLFGRVLTVLVLAAGLSVGWPRPPVPLQSKSGFNLVWQKWSPEAVARLRAEGRVVYVDFTARWCFTCQTNKAAVFSSAALLDALAAKNVALLKADWTSHDAEITKGLAEFGRDAVPLNLIYAPGRDQPVVLRTLLTPDTVLSALTEVTATR